MSAASVSPPTGNAAGVTGSVTPDVTPTGGSTMQRDGFFCRLGEGDTLPLTVGGWLAAWALVIWAWGALVALCWALSRRHQPALKILAATGGVFQLGHLVEHWLTLAGLWETTTDPTVSPWALHLVAGLAEVFGDGQARVGLEAMHFHGDLIYWCAVAAWWGLVVGPVSTTALAAQTVHQLEHLSLFATTLLTGHAYGATTLGPVWARIIAHWALNMVGTVAWGLSAWWMLTATIRRRAVAAAGLAVAR